LYAGKIILKDLNRVGIFIDELSQHN
jgi:hypothetical protein